MTPSPPRSRWLMYRQDAADVFAGLLVLARRRWRLLVALALLMVFAQMLYDAEYAGSDVLVRGPRIFSWAKGVVPGDYVNIDDPDTPQIVDLLPKGLESIQPQYVCQGSVYDCRFLATVAALASTDTGREAIADMIRSNGDGTMTVTFPGAPDEPVTVRTPTFAELELYAHARNEDGWHAGYWLPILEKAYGRYRTDHQSLIEKVFRFFKHGMLEGRWTSRPQLLGFGASFGAKDENAAILLTGEPMARIKTTSWEFGDFGLGKDYVSERQMRSWLDRPKVIDEIYAEQDSAIVKARASGKIVTATTEISGDAERQGLRSSHAYAVIDYESGKRRMRILDPYGNGDFVEQASHKLRDWPDDGIFWLTLPEFNKYFSHLQYQSAAGP